MSRKSSSPGWGIPACPAIRVGARKAAVPTALGYDLIANPALHAGLDYGVRFADSQREPIRRLPQT
jgi:hypothetical protein